jgi:hypothetical protein
MVIAIIALSLQTYFHCLSRNSWLNNLIHILTISFNITSSFGIERVSSFSKINDILAPSTIPGMKTFNTIRVYTSEWEACHSRKLSRVILEIDFSTYKSQKKSLGV